MAEWDFHKKADWLYSLALAEWEKVEYWREIEELCETKAELEAAEKNIEYYRERAFAFNEIFQNFIKEGDKTSK